ncbi:MAG TPA: two-component sensor histidine kinase, partial [Bacillota bacterium]|nr:two-component sensor histidine kinase [Bacillota bacterium]
MRIKISNRMKSYFVPDSLRGQLLARTLIILAVILLLIGVLQYLFMSEVIYQNKASSLQSQLMSIPHDVWDQQLGSSDSIDPMRREKGPPRFFIPQANLAYIDVSGNYTVILSGPNGENPPKLDTQEYINLLNKKPRLYYKVVNDGKEEQLVVLQPIGHPGHQNGIAQISTITNPLKDLLMRQLFTFLGLSVIAMLFG